VEVVVQTCRLANRFARELVSVGTGRCSVVLSIRPVAVREDDDLVDDITSRLLPSAPV